MQDGPTEVAEGPTEVVQAGERRSAGLESLRALAALAVLLAHVFAYSHGWEPVIYQGFLHRAIMGGGFAVQLFFALSGYLLYRAFAKRDFADGHVNLATYARNRALRILPLYYVVVVVLLVFTQNSGTGNQWWRFLLFAEEFSTTTAQKIDGPMWSLVVEIFFYVLLPVLAWAVAHVSRRSPGRALLVLLVLGVLSAVLHELNPAPTVLWSFSFPSTFYGFVPGLILAILEVSWQGRRPRQLAGLAANSDAWVVASALLWLVICWKYSLVLLTAPASFLLVGACVLPLSNKRFVRLLNWRPLALVGVASYSLYLWHVPIIEHVLPHAPHGTLGLLAVVLPLSLGIAAASYALVERTALRFRGRWADGGTTVKAAPRAGQVAEQAPVAWSDRSKVATLAALALIVRLVAIALTHPLRLSGDAVDYNRIGRLLAAGHGFGSSVLSPSGGPTAFRAPLYPLFLGGIYRLTGDSITAARLLQAALGVGTVVLVGLIAYLLWGKRVAWVAASVAAVFPSLVVTSTGLMSESLYIPLELLAVAAVLMALRVAVHRWRWLTVSGVSAGLGVLTRPNGSVLVLALGAFMVLTTSRGFRLRALRGPAVLAVAALVVVTPWEIRDFVTFHKFVPVATIDGYNLAGEYNADSASDGYPTHYQWRPPIGVKTLAPLFKDRNLNEATLGDKLWSEGMTWIEDHPSAVPEAYLWNTLRMTDLGGVNESTENMAEFGFGRRAAEIEMGAFWAIACLAVLGFATRRIRRAPVAIWLVPLMLWLISAPFLGTIRIRAPIDPFVVLAAAVGAVALTERLAGSKTTQLKRRSLATTPFLFQMFRRGGAITSQGGCPRSTQIVANTQPFSELKDDIAD